MLALEKRVEDLMDQSALVARVDRVAVLRLLYRA